MNGRPSWFCECESTKVKRKHWKSRATVRCLPRTSAVHKMIISSNELKAKLCRQGKRLSACHCYGNACACYPLTLARTTRTCLCCFSWFWSPSSYVASAMTQMDGTAATANLPLIAPFTARWHGIKWEHSEDVGEDNHQFLVAQYVSIRTEGLLCSPLSPFSLPQQWPLQHAQLLILCAQWGKEGPRLLYTSKSLMDWPTQWDLD